VKFDVSLEKCYSFNLGHALIATIKSSSIIFDMKLLFTMQSNSKAWNWYNISEA
jgi:hypothetical protein